ncbi:hypothetical protein [Montanilutibacter psychrotolerans]|uniref:Uncharacterized protein n=1 Tax=Montanilutibacter psychrotolerans TaxID=1327343 RepID=A0A3M8T1F2_9GAMM|nr:hypothetical protein [Lysobacter psychrotolerans]RNF85334.1 hypothetical protein EER27_06105 [Lysobacter psychrotolerans]
MSARNTPVLLTAIAAAALAGYGVRSMMAASPSSADIAALEARIQVLEQHQTGTGGTATNSAHGVARSDPLPGGPSPTSSATRPGGGLRMGEQTVSPQEMARMQAVRAAQLDAAFRREPLDASWAMQAENALQAAARSDALIATGITPTAVDTQCRSRQCRVLARFKPGDDIEGWMSSYALSTATSMARAETVVRQLPDGSSELVIVGTRP